MADSVWRHPWPPDIITYLVLSTNLEGNITNSDLELATFILHKTTLLASVPTARMAALHYGPDNTPTVSWSTSEDLHINTVVAELILTHVIHSRHFSLNTSVFNHLGKENFMVDDASRILHLFGTSFLAHMSVAYLQKHGLRNISLPPP